MSKITITTNEAPWMHLVVEWSFLAAWMKMHWRVDEWWQRKWFGEGS